MIYKYGLNDNPKFLDYSIIKKKIEDTIAYMTGKVNINVVHELLNSIIDLDIINEDNSYIIENNSLNIDDSFNILDDNNNSENENQSDNEISDELSLKKDINFN